MKNLARKYEIWIEAEEYDIELDRHNDEEYCNAIIILSSASNIGINVWSENFF